MTAPTRTQHFWTAEQLRAAGWERSRLDWGGWYMWIHPDGEYMPGNVHGLWLESPPPPPELSDGETATKLDWLRELVERYEGTGMGDVLRWAHRNSKAAVEYERAYRVADAVRTHEAGDKLRNAVRGRGE